MASKKFSEFDLSVNDNPIELVGLQTNNNVRTGLVRPVYKDEEGTIAATKIVANEVEGVKVVTNTIQSKSGDSLNFVRDTNQSVSFEVLHTGNLDLIPPPITDHGSLTGLSNDDHPQYALLSSATFSGALRASLDPVADRDVVPFKFFKDELNKNATRGVQWKYGGSTATAPATGSLKIVTTSGQYRDILLNKTDANGFPRSAGFLLAGDTLIISTSPTAFARYLVLATPTDMVTYWEVECRRTDTQGSTALPPIDTILTVVGTLSGTDTVEEYIPISQKGAPDGVTPLDSNGMIPSQFINISGFQYKGGWDAAPGILPQDGVSGSLYSITNAGTLLVVPPASTTNTPVLTLCNVGELIAYNSGNDLWYLFTASTAIGDARYVRLAGSTMTGHLSVPAGASGSQVRRASETDTLLAAKAPIASPALTGLPTAPTPTAGTNTTQIATTAFVKDAITTANVTQGNVVGPVSSVDNYIPQWSGITGRLLKGGINPSTLATVTDLSLYAKLNSPTFTGSVKAPTLPANTAGQNVATVDYVNTEAALVSSENIAQHNNNASSHSGILAPLASPAFTGIPVAPTPVSTDNSTKIATTEFVKNAVSNAGGGDVVGPGSSTNDFIPQWNGVTGQLLKAGIPVSTFATPASVALKADITYVDAQIATRAPLASPALTGVPVAPTAAQGTNTTQLATTAHVFAGLATRAALASPAFTGVPTAPTAPNGTNTTQLATTAFVIANAASGGGSGTVNGPANTTLGHLAQWNNTTGTLLSAGVPVSTFATPAQVGLKADIASPTFTGIPRAPTPAGSVNDTQLATMSATHAVALTYANQRVPITGDSAVNGRITVIRSGQNNWDNAALECRAGDTGNALIAFHRPNAWAATFGAVGTNLQGSANIVSVENIVGFSDIRLKTNIEVIPNALDKVSKIRGVTYERIDLNNVRQTGLIAQEVREVLPEAVTEMEDEDKTLGVAYGNLVGLLVEAIKELVERVEVLENGAS